jgi:hypothetical protein
MKLEDRIKALLEGKKEDAKSEDELVKDAGVEDDADDKEDDGKTDFSKDEGATDDSKNAVNVEGGTEGDDDDDGEGDDESEDEGEDTPAKKTLTKEDYTEHQYNAEHEQPGMKKRDNMPEKLKPEVKADAKIGNVGELDSKLKVGKGKKDGEGVKGSKTSGANDDNSRNNVDKQALPKKELKVTVGEHMEAMFAGQELSEEFVEKATTIFESAVAAVVEERLAEEVEAMQEDFQVKLDEAVSAVQGELVEQVDGFLNHVVEQWIQDNAVALESGIKVEMVSGFVDGLKNLFKEHHIEVPEDKLNVVEEQASKIEELQVALVAIDEAHDDVVAENVSLKRKIIMTSVAESLTMTQREKFAGLCESVQYVSEEDFAKRLQTVKESYFHVTKTGSEQMIKEDVSAPASNGNVNVYAEALRSPLKF